jgi:hypothetical protein
MTRSIWPETLFRPRVQTTTVLGGVDGIPTKQEPSTLDQSEPNRCSSVHRDWLD